MCWFYDLLCRIWRWVVSLRGLVPQTFAIPLAAGLAQKQDPRALEAPGLTICKDAQFDELGGLQTRYPFSLLGEALSDCRRIVENGDELLVFTKTGLLSWDSANEEWVDKGTHLAVKVEEETTFATTSDQRNADRAELAGVVVYAWQDAAGVYVAAKDKETGATVYGPSLLGTGDERPRLVALETRILLFAVTGDPELVCYSIDPADVAGSMAASIATVVASPNFNYNYDVTRLIGQDTAVGVARRATTTAYEVFTVTAGQTVTAATKARTCSGALAISSHPAGTHVQVIRTETAAIKGDYLSIAGPFTDVATAQAIGTATDGSPDHITAAYRSVADSGQFRCYVFWSGGSIMERNWVDTGGTLGTAGAFVRLLNLASRAFDHEGRVFLWTSFLAESTFISGGFAPQFQYELQQTYFLYRDDAFLTAKAATSRAGDLATATLLPGVQNTSGSAYAWAGSVRGIVPIGGSGRRRTKYEAHSPRDIAFTFDSDEARRCARLGGTLYITGGEILQYDGAELTEVGFHIYPHTLALALGGSGSIPDGTYAYKQAWRSDNARGEVDRSTSATVGTKEVTSGPQEMDIDWTPLYTTHKSRIAVETWRTKVNPTEDFPFYLITDRDPSQTSNPNRYLANDPTSATGTQLVDDLTDTELPDSGSHPENGAVLESLAPPAATIILASADRLFLAGVAGEPSTVRYSKLRADGEVASFNDALAVPVPREGGAITALAFLNETLVVFKETAIYALPGDGFDNLGGGINYGPARVLSADVGAVNHESVALTPAGLVFKSSKGWYLLGRGWGVEYIGGPVSDYDGDTVVAVHVVESQHQVRCLTTSRMLVLDYLANQWSEWTVGDGVHACMWRGKHVYLTATGPKEQLAAYTGVDYGLDIETAWIPLGSPGWGRVWKLVVLGEIRGAFKLRVRLARNYQTIYFQDKVWTPNTATAGEPLEVKHGPSIQELEAIKLRLTAVATDGESAPSTEAMKLTRLLLELGLERGVRPLAAAQRQ